MELFDEAISVVREAHRLFCFTAAKHFLLKLCHGSRLVVPDSQFKDHKLAWRHVRGVKEKLL
jgi:hypothetical protein